MFTPHTTALPSIGIGCATFGREIDDEDSFEILDAALAHGITHFDTAEIYGDGRSESILGEWLGKRFPLLEALEIASKIIPPFNADTIERAVDACLGRLQIPRLDLLYLHRWDAQARSVETLRTLDKLVTSGRVRRLGASNFSKAELTETLRLQELHSLTRFTALQNNHNFAVSDVNLCYRKYCQAEAVQVVSFSPLGAGFLSGKYRDGVAVDSRFSHVPGLQPIYFNEVAWERLKLLEQTASRTGVSQVQLALAWALNQPNVDMVLIGARSPAHIRQAFDARNLDIASLFTTSEATI